MATREFFWRLLALAACSLGAPVQAVTIHFVAQDLPDVVAGQDRWSYAYSLSGTFADFGGVNLLYPAAAYADLAVGVAPDASRWSNTVTQPDPILGADGLLSLSAIGAQNPVELPFTVEFTWLGSGSPGAQDFEVFDDSFDVVATGQTAPLGTPAIPEPGGLLLVGSALALLSRRPATAA